MEPKTKVNANPEAGARRPAGKTGDCEESLRKSKMPKESAVTTVSPDANKGKCKELASANMDGNPKKRTRNVWGGETVKGTGQEN